MKIGFMFGAGAETEYGLPTGGDFALNIFRQDSSKSKETFKNQRNNIDANSSYSQWLPLDYMSKSITVFRKKAYEDIIRSTVEQNRDFIITKLNDIDQIAEEIVSTLKEQQIDIDSAFKNINSRSVLDSHMNQVISFVKEFEEGNKLFTSNYFSALLMAYKVIKQSKAHESNELGKIVTAILQLQIGALGEKLSRKINDGVFEKKDDDLDILDDIGDIILLNYQSVGMFGLEYLLEIQESKPDKSESIILLFAQKLIEKIYSCVLDYKSLIDSNWMYLYHPKNEWSKFCKISIFLLNVQNYITKIYNELDRNKIGYYDDIAKSVEDGFFEITTIGTSNYTPLVETKIHNVNITYLNGSTSLWYDPYLNKTGSKDELDHLNHFLVPLMFTQSGTKPMVSIDLSSKYVAYYNNLKKSDIICVIGFGFNSDDEHINGLFRDLVDSQEKELIIITNNYSTKEKNISKKLKIQKSHKITVLHVDNERKINQSIWTDFIINNYSVLE